MTSTHSVPTGRPPLGTPAVGDDVFVLEGGTRHATTTPATITAVGRAWLTIEGRGRKWRLRRDTQKDNHGIGYGTHFLTPAQLAYEQEAAAAGKFLREQGLDVRYDSPWYGSTGNIALAELLRQALSGGTD